MSKRGIVITCWLGLIAGMALPASAQMPEFKEKPRMYTYVALWELPRNQWGEWDKLEAGDQKIVQDAMASGAIVAYGDDTSLIHQPGHPTHDDWFSSMSMAGLMNTLDQFYKSGRTQSPVQESATKHWDSIFVSRYYNWHPGSWQRVYSYGWSYKLKADAPNDAIDILAKNALVPVMEKMLADGTIHEYEIDTEAVHTEAPGTFWISWIGSNAEALDKVLGSVRDAVKTNQLISPSFDSMVDFTEHRDALARTNATYK
jgi:hypothetical protein